MENTNKDISLNKILNGVAWGAIFVLLGAGWLASSIYALEIGAYLAIGVGTILVAINLVRPSLGIKISKFSLFIGLLALVLGGAGMLSYSLPFIPTFIVLVGLFVIAEGLQKVTTQKQRQM